MNVALASCNIAAPFPLIEFFNMFKPRCLVDSTYPTFCPARFYCTSPSNYAMCEDGYYCKSGSVVPVKCGPGASCPAGSTVPGGDSNSLSNLLWFIFVVFIIFKCHDCLGKAAKTVEQREMQDLLSSLNEDGPGIFENNEINASNDPAEDTFKIQFKNLRFQLPNGPVILQGISGVLAPGTLTAIMGASGAGKTTLMNIITGKLIKTGGTIALSGVVCSSLRSHRRRLSFVPQEDVMHRQLTVLQNVQFAAELQLPPNMHYLDKLRRVHSVLGKLQLEHARHTIIGDDLVRGISGGQRKRVNIALELVGNRPILFLDEPTTGLDSVTATDLAITLGKIAKSCKMTVTAVLHSPGIRAYAAFTHLILLQTGGTEVYVGEARLCEKYLSSIGFNLPLDDSEPFPDFLMECLAGVHHPVGTSNWDHMTGFGKVGDEMPIFAPDMCEGQQHHKGTALPSFWFQFSLCLQRATCQQYTSFGGVLGATILSNYMFGLLLGNLGGGSDGLILLGPFPDDICEMQHPDIIPVCKGLQANGYLGAFSDAAFIYMAANSAVATCTFGAEIAIYWRECSIGLNTNAYFWAKAVGDIPKCFISALSTYLGVRPNFETQMKNSDFLTSFVMIISFSYATGYLVSFLIPFAKCNLVCVCWSMVMGSIFGGLAMKMSEGVIILLTL